MLNWFEELKVKVPGGQAKLADCRRPCPGGVCKIAIRPGGCVRELAKPARLRGCRSQDDQDGIVNAEAVIALNGANVLSDFAANGAYEEAKLYMTLAR